MAIYPANYKVIVTTTEATKDYDRDGSGQPYFMVWAYSGKEAATKARKACPAGAKILNVDRKD